MTTLELNFYVVSSCDFVQLDYFVIRNRIKNFLDHIDGGSKAQATACHS